MEVSFFPSSWIVISESLLSTNVAFLIFKILSPRIVEVPNVASPLFVESELALPGWCHVVQVLGSGLRAQILL